MDQHARRHLTSRLLTAQRQRQDALDDIALFLRNAQNGAEGGWHNLATTVAFGAAAQAKIEALTEVFDANPPKE